MSSSTRSAARLGILAPVATLYVRDFPEELQRRLRVAAAMSDETMKDLVIRAVEAEVARIEKRRRP